MVLLLLIDKLEVKGNDPSRDGSKKSAAVSSNGERPSKVARSGALRDTRRLKVIPAPCRQGSEDKEINAEHLARAWDVREGADLLLV